MTKIKICGITNLHDALLSAQAGADALGFIFAPSPRCVTPEKAGKIINELPPFITKVGVFGEEKMQSIKEIMRYCALDRAQLHGNFDNECLIELEGKAIKVFTMTSEHVLEKIKNFSQPFFMLDLPKEKGDLGGIPWSVVKAAKKWGQFVLAGRLSPENVEEALELAKPYGVDVCRGVEKIPGVKCPERIHEFILKVKKWDGILKNI